MREHCQGVVVLGVAALAGCSSSTSPAPPAEVQFTTDAASYEWVPHTTPPAMTVKFINGTSTEMALQVCAVPSLIVADVITEQRQQDNSWAPIAYGRVDCTGAVLSELDVPGGTSLAVPGGRRSPPLLAGNYRMKLAYSPRWTPASVDTVVSNSFAVVGNYAP